MRTTAPDEETLLKSFRRLGPKLREQVLEIVAAMAVRAHRSSDSRSVEGLWHDLPMDTSDEAISELRRDVWGSFPRDMPE